MVKTILFFLNFQFAQSFTVRANASRNSEFIILFIYYHFPSEDNIEMSIKKKKKADGYLEGDSGLSVTCAFKEIIGPEKAKSCKPNPTWSGPLTQ